ncbi:hypothetical protein Misp01_22510 [Microtetraspora sp. NBRC 13810]|uniref:hypothetical protein n=1 Tax=Microtetraspora sp. NBRC 13810 TaxID=3030990 RepID=UPI0024A1FC2E|nr:hypothetical protein [Microtetraspora sp. NBRC 13810]GLW07121.1 hypothetical protein Misp01_22510 [Microtetraspora sp. NBRC 13810]
MYARVSVAGGAGKADLAFMVESVSHPELAQVWEDLMSRWAPVPRSAEPRDIDPFLARLAADGLWLFEATSGIPLSEPVRQALRERLAALAEAADTPDTT